MVIKLNRGDLHNGTVTHHQIKGCPGENLTALGLFQPSVRVIGLWVIIVLKAAQYAISVCDENNFLRAFRRVG